MDSFNEKFNKVSEDIVKAIGKLKYSDAESDYIRVNIMININNLLKSYEDYTKSVDILMKNQEENRQKSLIKEFK